MKDELDIMVVNKKGELHYWTQKFSIQYGTSDRLIKKLIKLKDKGKDFKLTFEFVPVGRNNKCIESKAIDEIGQDYSTVAYVKIVSVEEINLKKRFVSF